MSGWFATIGQNSKRKNRYSTATRWYQTILYILFMTYYSYLSLQNDVRLSFNREKQQQQQKQQKRQKNTQKHPLDSTTFAQHILLTDIISQWVQVLSSLRLRPRSAPTLAVKFELPSLPTSFYPPPCDIPCVSRINTLTTHALFTWCPLHSFLQLIWSKNSFFCSSTNSPFCTDQQRNVKHTHKISSTPLCITHISRLVVGPEQQEQKPTP